MTSIDIIIPVYNEEEALPQCIATLSAFVRKDMSGSDWQIIVADNGSTDSTREVAEKLSSEQERVSLIHLKKKGRGRALFKAWTRSKADVMCYMDVDLSTRLDALPALVGAIEDGFDVAIGTRLAKGSRVEKRSFKREFISRSYNQLIKCMFRTRFSDAQCGFKAINQKASNQLIPLIKDKEWFFDSELLILTEKNGYKLKEVPVHWVDDPDTRVRVFSTAWADFRGLLRLRFGGVPKPRPRVSEPNP